MSKINNDKKRFPIIVSRELITYPAFSITLVVSRKETLNAIEHSQKEADNTVILITQKNNDLDNIEIVNLFTTGILCKIQKIENDEFNPNQKIISLIGIKRVNLIETEIKDGFVSAIPSQFKETIGNSTNVQTMHKKLIDEFKATMNKLPANITKESLEPFLSSSTSELIDAFSFYLPLELSLKNQILIEPVLEKRLKIVIEILEKNTNTKKINNQQVDRDINEKVKNKLNDQQREFYLREQLKAIKEELDEISGQSSEIDEFTKRVNNNPYPKIIKEKVLSEIKRLESTPSAAQEANIIRTYIETLLDLPYWQKDNEKIDISHAKKVLDKHHFGLEKVKERIIEYLAVKAKNPDSKGTILCLLGAPGTGKTSLVKAIAESLNRKMIKISLGGIRDEAEIRGHRRTYIAAMPGKLITSMKKAGVINPVILLDELDKMSSDFKGDPASAMLEVLDPEQNKHFQDHFVEEEYDLSKVMFIATANYYENIPHALLDRLEIIDLSSYTELEKTNIAVDHLIPRALEETKVSKQLFKISNDSIKFLIRHYTMEAGVRQLYRVIEKLARKVLVDELNGKIKSNFKIDNKKIIEYLGKERFDFGKKDLKPQIGTVTGLAWTAYGGDILQIEVSLYPGKGNVILTGTLKDVMKESATIALSYVKANAKEFGIDTSKEEFKDIFTKNDFHIHVPEGATPKDGPSAGVTFTTAIISALTKKPVSPLIGMTGEITLRGKVLQIGGLKEKSISAYRSGLQKIFVPFTNQKDISEIPDEVKKGLEIVLVKNYFDLSKEVFSLK